jgi:hypothetical protein
MQLLLVFIKFSFAASHQSYQFEHLTESIYINIERKLEYYLMSSKSIYWRFTNRNNYIDHQII